MSVRSSTPASDLPLKNRPQSLRRITSPIQDGSSFRVRTDAEVRVRGCGDAEPKTVMIDAIYLKANRTAWSLRVKKGISAA